ncbi:T9SS type A sorting domain-containing protein [Persicobacter psychrovividus]|uniref:T9SS type A sorting domain-containing protein n=1 Tax=Persicobacter psychrovividus TaxID=387638 RepID=A0ABM7VCH0_9BACT|nr:hypothetical protein PEPS_08720 [Persicobacter psychrovividus]
MRQINTKNSILTKIDIRMRKLILLLLVGVLLPSVGWAQVTWVGPLYGDWAVGSNWSTGNVPDQDDDVQVNSGGFPIVYSTPAVCNSLTIKGGGYFAVGDKYDSLLAGKLTIVNDLIVENSRGVVGTFYIEYPQSELVVGRDLLVSGTITIDPQTNINFNGDGQTVSVLPNSLPYQNLILSGGSKTLPFSLEIKGDFISTASSVIAPVNATDTCTVIFSGTAVQQAASINYRNINITHSNGIDFNGEDVTIQGNIDGTSTINNAGVLTFDASVPIKQDLGSMTFTNIGEMIMDNGEKLYKSPLNVSKLTITDDAILITTPSVTAPIIVNAGTFDTDGITATTSFTNAATGTVDVTTFTVGALSSANDFICDGTFTSTGAVTVTGGEFSAITMNASNNVQISGVDGSSSITTLNMKGSGTPQLGVTGFNLGDVNFTETSTTTIDPATTVGGDVVIEANATLSSNAKLTVQGSLTNHGSLQPGAELEVQGGLINNGSFTPGGKVDAKGSWENNGTFTHNNQTVCFSRTSGVQNLEGTNSFYDLEFSGLGQKTIANAADVNVFHELKFSGSDVVALTTGNSLTLKASSGNQAFIAETTNAPSIVGDVNVEMYYPFTSKGYVHIAVPVANMPLSYWNGQNGFQVYVGTGNPSVFTYDESQSPSGWVGITSVNDVMSPGHGVNTYLYQSFISGSKVLTSQGDLSFGNVSVPLTYTPAAQKGFNLMSNPYVCPLDVGAVIDGFTGGVLQGNAIQILSKTSGNYEVFTDGDSIGVAQSFMAQVTANFTYNFTESMKSNGVYISPRREVVDDKYKLTLSLLGDDQVDDKAYLYLSDSDLSRYSLDKIEGQGNSVEFVSPLRNRVIEVSNLPHQEDTLMFPLVTQYKRRLSGVQEFKLDGTEDLITLGFVVQLYDAHEDKYIGVEDLKSGYSYNVDTDSERSANRFSLVVLREKEVLSSDNKRVWFSPNPVHSGGALRFLDPLNLGECKVIVWNQQGQVVDEFYSLNQQIIKRAWLNTPGIYILRLVTPDGVYSEKIIVN